MAPASSRQQEGGCRHGVTHSRHLPSSAKSVAHLATERKFDFAGHHPQPGSVWKVLWRARYLTLISNRSGPCLRRLCILPAVVVDTVLVRACGEKGSFYLEAGRITTSSSVIDVCTGYPALTQATPPVSTATTPRGDDAGNSAHGAILRSRLIVVKDEIDIVSLYFPSRRGFFGNLLQARRDSLNRLFNFFYSNSHDCRWRFVSISTTVGFDLKLSLPCKCTPIVAIRIADQDWFASNCF